MKAYKEVAAHYEDCFKVYGDTPRGLDWPNEADMLRRYQTMAELFVSDTLEISVLDFGCGTSRFLDYLHSLERKNINYAGLDIAQSFVDYSKNKNPDVTYYCLDVLADSSALPNFDYVIMNGLFTVKKDLSFEEMFFFMKKVLGIMAKKCNKGFAFNLMSKQVDWERNDLFHMPFDLLASFLVNEITRNFVIRNDYGLFEYTVYVYPNKLTRK